MVLAITSILFFSMPIVATTIANSLEKQHSSLVFSETLPHDVIVVLGGGLRIPTAPANRIQLGITSDRYLLAAELYKAGKAKKIILSGGNLYEQPGLHGEAFYARELLISWGVDQKHIVTDQTSKTTEQNKTYTFDLLHEHKFDSILLVTSALHMPRSLALFHSESVKITPAVADQQVRKINAPAWTKISPNAEALLLSTKALHEYYGSWFYKLKKLKAE